ncbi:ATP-binding protein [Streptomyces mirabilis]|uniref:ATP-binding protein n=1 Tax=Streptomyces mirabilis TaxID=68239 RepID=UPI00364773FC
MDLKMADLLAPPTAPSGVRATTHSTPGQLEMDLAVTPHAVSNVRTIVVAHLRLWGLTDLTDRAALVMSELLTNVLDHARPLPGTRTASAHITLTRVPDGLFLCVRDHDPNPPRDAHAATDDEHGRGLLLVMDSADDYGVSPTSGGKDVWATILRRGDE